jgi:hypothetical protein
MFNNNNINKNQITKTWLTGKKSVTLVIERKLAEEYDLIDPQYVILERKEDGILIRKLESLIQNAKRKNTNNVFESRYSVGPQRRDSNNSTFSKIPLKTSYSNNSHHHKKVPDSKQEIIQNYRKQIDLILDEPHDKFWILKISPYEIDIFGYDDKIDYREKVLKPIICESARKRSIDFQSALDVVYPRLEWKGRY